MEKWNEIIESWESYVKDQNFVKLTLSKPFPKSSELQNIYIRTVRIKGEDLMQWTYRYQTRDETKNYDFETSKTNLLDLLYHDFRAVTIFSLKEDAQFLISKKGKLSSRRQAATFKNMPDFSNDRSKEKRAEQQAPYLYHLGIMDANGDLIPKMADKYRQINKYLEIIEGLVKHSKLPKKIKVVDMGSGKGYLSFALYDFLTRQKGFEVEMYGVELRTELVDLCNDISKTCGFEGLNFVAQRIENFEIDKIDILIALHACDTATDDALFTGIQKNANLIVCAPCCHKQLRQQSKGKSTDNPMLKHGIFKERAYEMLTDTLRGLILEKEAYKTKIFEFVSNEHTRKNIMMVGMKSVNSNADSEALEAKIEELKHEYNVDSQYLEQKLKEAN